MRRLVAVTLVICAAAIAQSQTQTARLYLEALDERGPVELVPSDVEIFDSGAKRTITKLVRADDPMRILLLADNGRSAQPFIQEIRAGVVAFADAMPTTHELGLVTIGNTPVVRQDPSLDRTQLKQIAKTLTTGGTTVLVNAVYEMYDRFLRDAGDRWPVLVIVTSDGTEGSGQFYPEKFAATGGNLTARLAALAQDIVADYDRTSSQYQLEYATDTGQPAADLKVSLLRDGVKMRMSRAGRIRD